MAQRFGGRYSHGQAGGVPQAGATVNPVGARANLMFVPPLVLALSSLTSGPVTLALGLGGALVLTAGVWLLRDGLRAEAEWSARAVARRPALPRKLLAAALTGAGAGLAALSGATGPVGAALYAVVAAALHVTAFGIDPMRDKRLDGVDDFQQDRVARVVDEAELYLAEMSERIGALRDRPLLVRLTAFQDSARAMIRAVQEDPRDLVAARRYLGVYLMGARDATAQYAALAARRDQPEARADYLSLLDDLQQNFTARTEKLLADDRSAMDIEMKVLRDRLARET